MTTHDSTHEVIVVDETPVEAVIVKDKKKLKLPIRPRDIMVFGAGIATTASLLLLAAVLNVKETPEV